MTPIPFSEFTELEERIIISALARYIEKMPPEAKIYDACTTLLEEMKYHFRERFSVISVKICTVEPSASFVTSVNGNATLEQLRHAEKDFRDNFYSFGIPPDVWEVEAKLLDDGSGAYFGEIRPNYGGRDCLAETIKGE